jgi:hypothetical protein
MKSKTWMRPRTRIRYQPDGSAKVYLEGRLERAVLAHAKRRGVTPQQLLDEATREALALPPRVVAA